MSMDSYVNQIQAGPDDQTTACAGMTGLMGLVRNLHGDAEAKRQQSDAVGLGVVPLVAALTTKNCAEETRRQAYKLLASLCLNNAEAGRRIAADDSVARAVLSTVKSASMDESGRLWIDCT